VTPVLHELITRSSLPLRSVEHDFAVDSSGFGTLLSAIKVLRPAGGSLALAGCNDAVNRMLEITRLNTLFHVYPTRTAAIEDMQRRTVPAQPA